MCLTTILCHCSFLFIWPPPISTLFPYTTLFRSGLGRSAGLVSALGIGVGTLVHVATAAVGLTALLMSSAAAFSAVRSEEHTSELQSRPHLVCRLLLEKKKNQKIHIVTD